MSSFLLLAETADWPENEDDEREEGEGDVGVSAEEGGDHLAVGHAAEAAVHEAEVWGREAAEEEADGRPQQAAARLHGRHARPAHATTALSSLADTWRVRPQNALYPFSALTDVLTRGLPSSE